VLPFVVCAGCHWCHCQVGVCHIVVVVVVLGLVMLVLVALVPGLGQVG